MDYKYDIIIIGAGPAGLNCAYHLKNSGKKVLILEKNKIIGPKVCAGGLTRKDIEYLKLPANIIGKSFNKITYYAKYISTEIRMKDDFIYTVDRSRLGKWQYHRIENKVPALLNAEVKNINKDHLETNVGNKYYYDYLVGADGSNSIVRKYLNIKIEMMGIGLQYIMPAGAHDKFELNYNSKLFGSWYAWIFPHDNFVSIGTGGDPKKIPAKIMHENLKLWMKKNDFDHRKGTFEAFPINNDYRGFKFDNIYLAGDAAGLASEFNGEGIYQALISGEEIARSILDSSYTPSKLKKVLRDKTRHARVLDILNKSGIFRPLVLELIGLGFKNKYLANKAFKHILN